VVAARPLQEPVARHGRFVMSRREIEQALEDLRTGKFMSHEERSRRVVANFLPFVLPQRQEKSAYRGRCIRGRFREVSEKYGTGELEGNHQG